MKAEIYTRTGLKEVSLNRRNAIKAKCMECSGFEEKEWLDCNFKDCPLYLYHTGREKQNYKKRHYAIRAYCLWCMNNQISEIHRCVSLNCPLFNFREYPGLK